ncbi:hypothetical protein [Aeromicrobium sp. UC242_57]|uniref:hypothetical protein n=1 Tax=Aeromicrobium sp. UC242_57 TaxID=3374624 RepID=UPI003793E7C0
MFSYNTSTFALENKHITKAGGDVQAITGGNGLVFAGCHCENWNYSDTAAYDSTSPGSTNITWSQADKVYYAAAYDAVTGDLAQEWTPEMRARIGRGVWALHVASDGTLWAGGTLTSAVRGERQERVGRAGSCADAPARTHGTETGQQRQGRAGRHGRQGQLRRSGKRCRDVRGVAQRPGRGDDLEPDGHGPRLTGERPLLRPRRRRVGQPLSLLGGRRADGEGRDDDPAAGGQHVALLLRRCHRSAE